MSEKNDNFDELKQLLKLKRHEVPPPGYFSNFSGDVVSRIQAGEGGGGESIFERLQSGSAFWSGVISLFSAKPGIIGGLATSVCLLLLFGVVLMDRTDSGEASAMTSELPTSLADAGVPDASPTLALAPPDAGTGIAVSTNPATCLQPVTGVFGSGQNAQFLPAGYVQPGQ